MSDILFNAPLPLTLTLNEIIIISASLEFHKSTLEYAGRGEEAELFTGIINKLEKVSLPTVNITSAVAR